MHWEEPHRWVGEGNSRLRALLLTPVIGKIEPTWKTTLAVLLQEVQGRDKKIACFDDE